MVNHCQWLLSISPTKDSLALSHLFHIIDIYSKQQKVLRVLLGAPVRSDALVIAMLLSIVVLYVGIKLARDL